MKFAVYYRVSTKKQGKSGLGLESQKAIIHHFFSADEIAAEFTDIESGAKERPELNKAIQLCKENGYTLAVAKIDRLSRITEDALRIYNELDRWLFACDIPQEKSARMDKFILTIQMAIADRERLLIKIRTKQALAAKKAQGFILGKPENLTDYSRERAKAALRAKAENNKNNRRAKLVVAQMRAAGATYRDIADELNSAGFKTSRDKQFKAMTVKRLAV